jgi:hypothetical protein
VARLVLLVAVLRFGALVFLLHLGVGHRVLAHVLAKVRADDDLLARHVELGLNFRLLGGPALLRFLHQDLAVHELVAHHAAHLLGVGAAALDLLLHQEVGACLRHRHAVDGGDGARSRLGFRCLFFLGRQRGLGKRQ